ncbi:rhodanese-like domain-containing protein [Acinetobacter sp.]|uniref:rhodanese-like domain-containing protein n=1 Tax=Acinetobacter sp. TaxID=472 RepID=UPI0035B3A19B
MERWLEFMGNHPILFGILGVLLVLFFVMESRRSGRKISPQSLGILTKAQNAMLIDLRDGKDFKQGHISGSRNIPYSQLDAHVEELKASDRPLIFICNLGQVAGTALQKVGHADSYRLDGGIMNWKGQGLPLVKTAEGKNSKSHK